ncbi:MAG: hypothetical protein AB7G75_23330 [Candidatus Binatia bacterium]
MKTWRYGVLLGIAVLFLAGSVNAYDGDCLSYTVEAGCGHDRSGYYDGYDDSQAHPLRIAAYAFHPVGYAVEWLVTRPIHALVSQPELEPIFGHRPHQWDFCCGMQEVDETPPAPVPAPAPAVSAADLDAIRHAAEEARAAAEEAKAAAEEAARAAEKSTRGFEKGLRK